MKIPKRVALGFGYTVHVRYMGRAEMDAKFTLAGEEPTDGFWDKDTMTIWLGDDLTLAQQRYLYVHELQHAVLDMLDQYLDVWTISERARPKRAPSRLPAVSLPSLAEIVLPGHSDTCS